MDASQYSAVETLRNGRRAEIRALKPTDRAGMLAAVANMNEDARYRRFFAPKRAFSEKEIEYFLNVDFVHHVALVAVLEGAIVGGGRYIESEPGRAEVAFAVDDDHQGLGIASRLMRHLALIAREAGVKELIAEVLPDNAPMLKVFERSGLPMTLRRDPDVVHVTLELSGR
ncbi:MAG: GNAT family N-acetyltransferase [Burkholderiales bacterium]